MLTISVATTTVSVNMLTISVATAPLIVNIYTKRRVDNKWRYNACLYFSSGEFATMAKAK